MNTPRPGTPGATRACPHCRELILETAAVCPGCKHHVRFEPGLQAAHDEAVRPLTIEGSFTNPAGDQAWEYSVVISIRNDKGVEVARKLVGVGALAPDEKRTFSLGIEMTPAKLKPVVPKAAIPRAAPHKPAGKPTPYRSPRATNS